MSGRRGADLLVEALRAAGVTRIFSLSGNQIMPVYDACLDAGIEIIHTRHEGAAVFMAEAYAQASGGLGVALVTAGGGIGNAVGALFSARAAEVPLLLLSGDAPRAQDGRGAFQELDQVSMTASSTKLSLRPARVVDLGTDCARAIRHAREGRPGPVHMVLPVDLLEAEIEAPAPATPAYDPAAHELGERDCDAILTAVAAAARPLILAGPVCNATRSPGLLSRLADALDAPAIAMESPRGLRDPALGDIAGVLGQADLVVALGKPVDFTLGFGAPKFAGPGCGWIVIDAEAQARDRAQRNLADRLALIAAAEPRAAARMLAERAQTPGASRAQWRDDVARAIAARSYDGDGGDGGGAGAITPLALCRAVGDWLAQADDSLLICDGGEFGQWTQAVLDAPRRIVNGTSGVIGGCLPYAIGARSALPEARIVTLMGDGTVGFHLPEFETAVRMGLPFVAVIGNDHRWNAEYQIQLRDYGAERITGVGLSGARYDLAVAGLGGHGEHVTRLDQLAPALTRAQDSGLPACINVEIEGIPAPSGGH